MTLHLQFGVFSTLGLVANWPIHFTDRMPRQRAHETDMHPAMVRTLTRRFRQQGMLRLLPEDVGVSVRARSPRVPDAVRQELERRALPAIIWEA
jgi:hypothetical protein